MKQRNSENLKAELDEKALSALQLADSEVAQRGVDCVERRV